MIQKNKEKLDGSITKLVNNFNKENECSIKEIRVSHEYGFNKYDNVIIKTVIEL